MNKSLLIISLFLMLTSCNEKITNDIVISTKVELNTAIKKIQIKTFRKENELDTLFKNTEIDSLKLYAEMMRDRYGR